jgi:hypothetical protein
MQITFILYGEFQWVSSTWVLFNLRSEILLLSFVTIIFSFLDTSIFQGTHETHKEFLQSCDFTNLANHEVNDT